MNILNSSFFTVERGACTVGCDESIGHGSHFLGDFAGWFGRRRGGPFVPGRIEGRALVCRVSRGLEGLDLDCGTGGLRSERRNRRRPVLSEGKKVGS